MSTILKAFKGFVFLKNSAEALTHFLGVLRNSERCLRNYEEFLRAPKEVVLLRNSTGVILESLK